MKKPSVETNSLFYKTLKNNNVDNSFKQMNRSLQLKVDGHLIKFDMSGGKIVQKP
jgi:hypothetical protein